MSKIEIGAALGGPLPQPTNGRPQARWLDRLASLVPVGLMAGFAVLAVWVLGDRIWPARAVELGSVLALPGQVSESRPDLEEGPQLALTWSGPALFQASGWIEPDPLPIKATALQDGVIDEVLVLEGETVQRGQLLATLIAEDTELDLATARGTLATRRSQWETHNGEVAVARSVKAHRTLEVKAAEARLVELIDDAERLGTLTEGSVPEQAVVQAELRVATQRAVIASLRAHRAESEHDLDRHLAMTEKYAAEVAVAETEVDRRELALARTRITAPVDGIVLRLHAIPGLKRMREGDDPDSATIAVLYQPDHLQARIDVPLEEASALAIGQTVRVRTSFLPDRVFQGQVTRIVGAADISRNTLQAKVAILDPDTRLRPEMLCRAEFLEPGAGPDSTGGAGLALWIPIAALSESADPAQVWVYDRNRNRVRSQEVRLEGEVRDGHRRVLEGLRPGDQVVLRPAVDLRSGDRIRVKEGGSS